MKKIKIIFLITGILTLSWLGAGFSAEKLKETMPFAVYTEKNARTDHFIPSGWMGDYGSIKLDQGLLDNPHSGATCIKITYRG